MTRLRSTRSCSRRRVFGIVAACLALLMQAFVAQPHVDMDVGAGAGAAHSAELLTEIGRDARATVDEQVCVVCQALARTGQMILSAAAPEPVRSRPEQGKPALWGAALFDRSAHPWFSRAPPL